MAVVFTCAQMIKMFNNVVVKISPQIIDVFILSILIAVPSGKNKLCLRIFKNCIKLFFFFCIPRIEIVAMSVNIRWVAIDKVSSFCFLQT